jgi:hypothetical protein
LTCASAPGCASPASCAVDRRRGDASLAARPQGVCRGLAPRRSQRVDARSRAVSVWKKSRIA